MKLKNLCNFGPSVKWYGAHPSIILFLYVDRKLYKNIDLYVYLILERRQDMSGF